MSSRASSREKNPYVVVVPGFVSALNLGLMLFIVDYYFDIQEKRGKKGVEAVSKDFSLKLESL
jgi:energy-converting hydrogenase Eha subunit B